MTNMQKTAVFTLLFLFLCAMPVVQAEELTAEEIMAKSNEAMSQPLRYTIDNGGITMVIYQKMLPDGSQATLHDMTSSELSSFQMTSLEYGDKKYEIYLDQEIAIDMAFRTQQLKSIQEKVAAIKQSHDNNKSTAAYQPVVIIQRDGRDYYQIDAISTQTPEAIEAFRKVFPSASLSNTSVIQRYVIDKETFLKISIESLTPEGTVISKLEYKAIAPQSDLTDDFFQLPPDFEVKTPTSDKEYVAIRTEIARARAPKSSPPKLEPIEFPAPTPTPLAQPLPPRRVREDHSAEVQSPPLFTQRRIVLIVVNVLLIAFIIRSLRKAKTK